VVTGVLSGFQTQLGTSFLCLIVLSLGLPCPCSAVLLLVLKPMTEGVATFSEHIFPAFQELF
jgi:hypothetical protein